MSYHILVLFMVFPYLLYSIISANHLITINFISPPQVTMADFMSTWVLNYGAGCTSVWISDSISEYLGSNTSSI